MQSEWFQELKKGYSEIVFIAPELREGEVLQGIYKGIVRNEDDREFYCFVYDGKINLYHKKPVCQVMKFQVNQEYQFKYESNEYRL